VETDRAGKLSFFDRLGRTYRHCNAFVVVDIDYESIDNNSHVSPIARYMAKKFANRFDGFWQ